MKTNKYEETKKKSLKTALIVTTSNDTNEIVYIEFGKIRFICVFELISLERLTQCKCSWQSAFIILDSVSAILNGVKWSKKDISIDGYCKNK